MPRKIDPKHVISGTGQAGAQSVGANALLFDSAVTSPDRDPALFTLKEEITDLSSRVEITENQNGDTQWLRDSEPVFYQVADGGTIEWGGTVANGGDGLLKLDGATLLVVLGVTPTDVSSRVPEWYDGGGTRFPTIYRHLRLLDGANEDIDVKTNVFIFSEQHVRIVVSDAPVVGLDPEVAFTDISNPNTYGTLVEVTFDSTQSHTIQDVIDAINGSGGQVQAQIGTTGNPALPAFAYAESELVGGQDGVFYEISELALGAVPTMEEGSVLAIQFDSIKHRKEHIEENGALNLIPSSRIVVLGKGVFEIEEATPNMHVIGRVIDDKFVFSNGQVLFKGGPQNTLQEDDVLRSDLNRGLQFGGPAPGNPLLYGSNYVGIDALRAYDFLLSPAVTGNLQAAINEIDSALDTQATDISTNTGNIATGEVFDRVYAKPANGIADSDVAPGQPFKVLNNGVTGAYGNIPVMGADLAAMVPVSSASRVATDGRYVVTANDSTAYIIDMNASTPSVTTQTFGGVWAGPPHGLAVGGGWVVGIGNNGSSEAILSAINLETPATKWTANLGLSSGFDANLALNPSRDRVYVTVTVSNITTIYQRSLTDGTSAGSSATWGDSGTDFAKVMSIVPVLDKVFVGGERTESFVYLKVYTYALVAETTIAAGGNWKVLAMCSDGTQIYVGLTDTSLVNHEVHVFDINDPYKETTATLATAKLNSGTVGEELYPFYADDRYLYLHQDQTLKRIDKRNVAQSTPISSLIDTASLLPPDPLIRGQMCSDGTFVYFLLAGSGIGVQVLDRKLRWYVKRSPNDQITYQSAYLV